MTNSDLQTIGQPLGQIAIAFLDIIEALKLQPSFDQASFNSKIESVLSELEAEQDWFRATILRATLRRGNDPRALD